jgi:hypothetical protein
MNFSSQQPAKLTPTSEFVQELTIILRSVRPDWSGVAQANNHLNSTLAYLGEV